MQSFSDRSHPTIDTAQPSVRHVQEMIRRKQAVALLIVGGQEMEGVILWQDIYALALHPGREIVEGRPFILVNRDHVVTIRQLD